MNDNSFTSNNDVEICDLSRSFTDLNKDNRRGILKTAKNLLKVQNTDIELVSVEGKEKENLK